jgi:hypothetical protein
VRKQDRIYQGINFGLFFGFAVSFFCCKGIYFTRFRKIIRTLFLYNGIIAQLFGTNEKSVYRYKTNKMRDICKSISQR